MVVALAGSVFLLLFSARAAAEGIDTVAATSPAPAGEGTPPPQPTSPPVPEAASSEPAEAPQPDGGGGIASVAAEREPPATSAAASPVPPASPSTADLPAPEAGADVNVPDGATAVRSIDQVPSPDQVPTTDQALELTQTAGQVPAKATATIAHSARSTVEAVDRVAPVDRVHTLAHDPLQTVRGTVRDLGLAPKGVEELLTSPGDAPSEVGIDAFLPPVKPAITRAGAAEFRADEPNDSPILQMFEVTGVEPLPLIAPGVSTGASPGNGRLGWGSLGDVSTGAVDEPSADFAAPDGNKPPAPESSQDGAPGAGGTSFIPIAALLALLALAAPAILRRLGAVPDLRPQAPFVCALERPG
jgi:hypothetical protein